MFWRGATEERVGGYTEDTSVGVARWFIESSMIIYVRLACSLWIIYLLFIIQCWFECSCYEYNIYVIVENSNFNNDYDDMMKLITRKIVIWYHSGDDDFLVVVWEVGWQETWAQGTACGWRFAELQGTHGIYFPMLMAFLSPEKSLTYVVVNHDKSLGWGPHPETTGRKTLSSSTNTWRQAACYAGAMLTGRLVRFGSHQTNGNW